jgi:predicted enzyme related to lactoylglutathione lyase
LQSREKATILPRRNPTHLREEIMIETNTGRFIWFELMTTDTEAAIAFYGDVVGWKSQPFAESPDPYSMWVGSQGPLGGVVKLPEQAAKMGAPPHWMAHVEVADVDATAAQVKELGGKVFVEPQDVPTVGRFSVIADPQGATISIFKPANSMASHDPTKHGEFVWCELLTTDSVAAFKFYSTLFGWEQTGSHDMGPHGVYLLYGRNGKALGGMMTKTPDMPMPSTWVYYIQVDDLEAAIGRATAKGAKVMMGPMDVPGGSRVVQLSDPQGVWFALHAGVVGANAAQA